VVTIRSAGWIRGQVFHVKPAVKRATVKIEEAAIAAIAILKQAIK
jgi:hypothetical protein